MKRKLTLMFCALYSTFMAMSTEVEKNLVRYSLDESNMTATIIKSWASGNYVIPDKIIHKNKRYTVTCIGKRSFWSCAKLNSISIPNSVVRIEERAFVACPQLRSIEIPNNVKYIGEGAFDNCSRLTSINVVAANPKGKKQSSYVIPTGVTNIGDWAFAWNEKLSSVAIPSGVTSIGEWAFYGCKKIKAIFLPNSITSIGEYAFHSCEKLSSISIPANVTSIGNGAFTECNSLKEVRYPSTLNILLTGIPTTAKTIPYTVKTTPQPKPANTQDKKLAKISWLEGNLSAGQYTFKIGIKSESKIEKVDVYVNENLERGIVAIDNDGYDMVVNRTVDILEGQNNTIKIVVTNASGDAVEEKSVTYKDKKVTPSGQPKRIALVMGNANYKVATKLKNPVNDATDVATKLENLGFTVIRSMDQTYKGMDLAIRDFGNQAKGYDVALFYYAGHGMQYDGINYIIPIDADLHEQMDAKYHCVNMNEVLEKMDGAKCPMKIVILDACRNNPFRSWTIRGADAGLCNMNAPTGTFIAFSTAPGRTAFDGTGRNSPYTAAILQILDVPGLSLTDFFQEVLEKVAKDTKEQQNPWTSGSFRGKFFFNKK